MFSKLNYIPSCLYKFHTMTLYVSAEDQHWNILVIECKSLSSDWEKVGAYLGLPFKLIDTIKRDNPKDSAGCWNEALKEWIKQNYNTKLFGRPSWRSLLKAVAEVDNLLFEKLAAKHSQPGMLIMNVCQVVVAT